MGSFLISEVRGMRLTQKPRSDAPHDLLKFWGIVRGCQPEERQEWISDQLGDKRLQRECNDEDLFERLWSVRNVRPMLLPTRWWSGTLESLDLPLVREEMLGFNHEDQG
jgi:hypothetical protein